MQLIKSILPLLSTLACSAYAETVLGAYIFHRHGDRTPKSLPPTNLTTLGYSQVYDSGTYYRSRYLAAESPHRIRGLNTEVVKLSQLSVTAPVDNVLQNSATGFLQGLYPPVGNQLSTETLANKSEVQAPLSGYQLIPVNIVSSGSGSEDNGWLQDATTCANAKVSSNNYFTSAEYNALSSSTKNFYTNLVPVVNGTFTADQVSYKNAYVGMCPIYKSNLLDLVLTYPKVYDLINVAEIHNSSIPSSSVLTEDVLLQTRTLADAHEWELAFNSSDNARAISGMQLAGEILAYLNGTITKQGAQKLGIQFGAYASFFSFFGLADLPAANPDFRGIPNYASSMVFELFTNADDVSTFPSTDDLRVRFLFHNGSASISNEPTVYPLFGGSAQDLSWTDFSNGISKFAIHTTQQWCTACGNTTGTCAQYAPTTNSNPPPTQQSSSHGMSAAIGGVIGAMVTLAVILGIEALAILLGGFRLVSKKRLANQPNSAAETVKA
jgi:hypothetical protein